MTTISEYTDINAAAEVLRIHPESVRRLVRRQELPAVKVGMKYLIPLASLEAFAQGYDGRVGPRAKPGATPTPKSRKRKAQQAERTRKLGEAIAAIKARGL